MALAMTALIGATSFAALDGLTRSRAAYEERVAQLGQLQRFFTLIGRDVRQASGVLNRGADGDLEPNLLVNDGSDMVLVLNRRGWHNPLGAVRSELQRVYYRFDGQTLFRGYWEAFDRVDGSDSRERPLMDEVKELRVRALPAEPSSNLERNWQVNWPAGDELDQLPAALEITLETTTMGTFTRIYELLPSE